MRQWVDKTLMSKKTQIFLSQSHDESKLTNTSDFFQLGHLNDNSDAVQVNL